MLDNLTIVALLVVLFWLIILGIFLIVSRRQPDVQAEMKALDEQLEKSERETTNR